ncbi:protein O-linked-mannose beta-1,4-N-acetylglucosaminyltransferase 2-like [Apostichopus japonicus]|uniref:protein O-linked-mannose beta-1,4-N-acetylglucosaminyltransferase 2-like n=1 Tax=Stichopus japonicus TaxID=307972 RepID=UPI003AB1CFCF
MWIYGAGLGGLCLAVVFVPTIWFLTNQGISHVDTYPQIHNATSAWCSGKSNVDRVCRFKNLCFSSVYDTFLFLHGEESILDGIPDQRFNPALVDLSSVADHNTQYFHYVDAAVENLLELPHRHHIFKMGKFLLFNRFNPDNIMHVFHDDLLPIFFTLHHHGQFKDGPNLTLLPFEGWTHGEFFDLYRVLSKDEPMLKLDLKEDTLTCFDEIYVGLSGLSTWYQYGFNIPQGPIPNHRLTSFHVKYFREFFQRKLNLRTTCPPNAKHGVLLSREENRLIVNEGELALKISYAFNMTMLTVSLETHSISQLIQEISCAKILVGVHGSLFILSLFLPPSSIVLEIFPFAVNPDRYTPYKTLASIPGLDLHYVSWRNMEERNSITHPDAAPQYGGIRHLKEEEQRRIILSVEVPPHLCCKDPEWLFRIYQDTVVNVTEIIKVVTEAMTSSSQDSSVGKASWIDGSLKHRLAPGFINDLTCVYRNDLGGSNIFRIAWLQPWNVDFIHLPGISYEVLVQGQGLETVDTFITNETFLDIIPSASIHVYFVWVKAVSMGTKGPQSWVRCSW